MQMMGKKPMEPDPVERMNFLDANNGSYFYLFEIGFKMNLYKIQNEFI